MDYQKVEDMGRYIETFREQGWEYVNSTFNGWHYFLDLEIEADKPLTFAVVNAAGEAVYSVTETDFEEEDIRLKLTPGRYQLSISVETGFEIECSLR